MKYFEDIKKRVQNRKMYAKLECVDSLISKNPHLILILSRYDDSEMQYFKKTIEKFYTIESYEVDTDSNGKINITFEVSK